MNRIEPVILIAALGFYALAMTSQGLIPYLEKSLTRPETVKNVDGQVVATPHRTDIENLGRKVYIREGCWYCIRNSCDPLIAIPTNGGRSARQESSSTTCRKCSAHDASVPICRVRAIAARTSGTTLIIGIRELWNPSR